MAIEQNNYPVSQNIQVIIKQKGLKQRTVAIKAGIDPLVFSNMLNGRHVIKANNIVKVAKALEVSPNRLFGFEDSA